MALTEHKLTADVTAGRTPVSGQPRTSTVVVVPSAATSTLALDAGTATSPVFPSYSRLTPPPPGTPRGDSAGSAPLRSRAIGPNPIHCAAT